MLVARVRCEYAMLILKPNCECCDADLPPDSAAAMICSFEYTFCLECATARLRGVCPNQLRSALNPDRYLGAAR